LHKMPKAPEAIIDRGSRKESPSKRLTSKKWDLTTEITGITDYTNPRHIIREDSEMILEKLKEQREDQKK